MKKYIEEFNHVTNTISNISWWYNSGIWSAITSCFSFPWNIWLGLILLPFALLMTGCKLVVLIREKYFKKIEQPKGEYISIQEASDILVPKLTNEQALFLETYPESCLWYSGTDDIQDCLNKSNNISLYILSKCKEGKIKLFGQHHPSSIMEEVGLGGIRFEFINRDFDTLNKGGSKNNRIKNLSVKKVEVESLISQLASTTHSLSYGKKLKDFLTKLLNILIKT